MLRDIQRCLCGGLKVNGKCENCDNARNEVESYISYHQVMDILQNYLTDKDEMIVRRYISKLAKERNEYVDINEQAVEYIERHWISYEDSKCYITKEEELEIPILECRELLEILGDINE